MRSLPVLFLALMTPCAGLAAAQEAAKTITVETIYAHGSPVGHPPSEMVWSPDAKHLTYLDRGELMEITFDTAKPRVLVSHAELAKLAGGADTEKDRDHRERYKMASFLWAPDARHLLFDVDGKLWLYDLAQKTGTLVGTTGEASGDDPKFSPDGKTISFIHHHGLSVLPLGGNGQPVDLAPAPNADTLRGEVDWLYSEELDARTNYLWSPDSRALAFLETDEKAVPTYPIEDWIPTHPTLDNQRYAQPGDPNPAVRVGVVAAGGGPILWVKLPFKMGDDYIPRFGWADAKTVWIETLTRDQKHQSIYLADAATGEARQVLEMTDTKYIDDKYEVFAGNGHLVLKQWTDGHTHLYLYRMDTAAKTPAVLERQLTQGPFDVGDVYRVDFERGIVNYASNEDDALNQQLNQVEFNGAHKLLTTAAGFHQGDFAPDGAAWVDTASTWNQAPTLSFCQGTNCRVFWRTDALAPYQVPMPKRVEARAADGSPLYGYLLLPAGAEASKGASIPLIVNPYGGPGVQSTTNRWNDSHLWDELLTQHGFAVLHADNRGMGGRGRDFEQACYHNFGPVELSDQLAVLDSVLAQNPALDRKRLGWWGWSWGGSFTLYALSHSDRFRMGVAVAPVTDWRNYDSTYTERYMGLPAEAAAEYKRFSVVNSAEKLKGHLLLVHGTGDDNVHMENTIQYVQRLIDADIPYDLQLYPRKTHSIAGPAARTHLFNRILAQFETYLKPTVE